MQVIIMCLLEEESYGYDIIRNLKDVGIEVDDGTLYPILRRLEDDKLLVSRWETTGPRPRKYYVITEYGRDIREKMLASLAVDERGAGDDERPDTEEELECTRG